MPVAATLLPLTQDDAEPDPVDDCFDDCQVLFELDILINGLGLRTCMINAFVDGQTGLATCDAMTDPAAALACYTALDASILADEAACYGDQEGADLEALAALNDCIEDCLAL